MSTVTTGPMASLDRDGYLVSLQGREPRPIGPNASIPFHELTVGSYEIGIEGIADHCTAAEDNPRNATVQPNETTLVEFEVACQTLIGTLKVQTFPEGTGVDPDGYLVSVDGGEPRPIGVRDSAFYLLEAGNHEVLLEDLAPGCVNVHAANPRIAEVYLFTGVNFFVRCD